MLDHPSRPNCINNLIGLPGDSGQSGFRLQLFSMVISGQWVQAILISNVAPYFVGPQLVPNCMQQSWTVFKSCNCQAKSYKEYNYLNLRLTRSPPNKLFSAKLPVCFNFQCASISLKVGENVVWVPNSLDPGGTPSYSPSHPDSSCLHTELWLWLV